MSARRRDWELIKEQAPDIAVWLTALSQAFGKPSAVRVEMLGSGEVVESGVFGRGLGFDDKAVK